MPVSWRHRTVRVRDDEDAITRTVLDVVRKGWMLSGESTAAGSKELVFRRAVTGRRSIGS